MREIIIDLQNSETWKIQLIIAINFIPSKDAEEEDKMQSKSDNVKFTSYNYANKVIAEVFDSLRLRYQGNLDTSMKGSEFIFDSAPLMHYKCHRVNFRRDGSYTDSPDWIKKEKGDNKT